MYICPECDGSGQLIVVAQRLQLTSSESVCCPLCRGKGVITHPDSRSEVDFFDAECSPAIAYRHRSAVGC